MRAALLLFALGLSACNGCGRKTGVGSEAGAPSASASSSAPVEAHRLAAVEKAEQTRSSAAVTEQDLSSRNAVLRRHAARALARIADADASAKLAKALADEDPVVVTWAAYGLGYACKGREPATVRALVMRAASLAASPPAPMPKSLLDGPQAAIADALGRCGTAEAEATLRAWLAGDKPRAEAAALALGRLASRRKRLDDASVVALLDAASDPEGALENALFAFTRLSNVDDNVEARLLEVAKSSLDKSGRRRAFAVRALGRAGDAATDVLEKLVSDDKLTASERADAARELAKRGVGGRAALGRALAALVPGPAALSDKALTSDAWGPLITTLGSLEPPVRGAAHDIVERLQETPLPDKASPTLKRRVVTLRCTAAALLAGTASLYSKLRSCDPEEGGEIGALATIHVLDRGPLKGARYSRFEELTRSEHPRVREAALELIPAHPEIPGVRNILVHALGAKDLGTITTAAQVIAAYPTRASKEPVAEAKEGEPPPPVVPDPRVVTALKKAFDRKRPPDAIETTSALTAAAGALQLLSFKPAIEKLCGSDNPTVRQAAEKALGLLGDKSKKCEAKSPGAAPPELGKAPAEPVKLVFQTDAGVLSLRLEPDLAPVTVTRVSELARSGFYDGIVFHRVVPGFVVQFGDPGGDGYGGAGKLPLRCETSPAPFDTLTVGVALAGRDTGSSQLFVTLGPFPHLDGDYPLIGRAQPGWDRVAEGDIIRKVTVSN